MPVMAQELVDRLAEHKTLRGAPRSELEWLVSTRNPSQTDYRRSVECEGCAGRGSLHHSFRAARSVCRRGAGPTKVVEWRAGDVTGMLPYSRLVTPPGDSRALEPLEVFAIPRDQLRKMTQECFEITSILVHTMIDRARLFTSSELQNEKMISLGKLSAGLAHELNNPASAIERCTDMVEDRLERLRGGYTLSGRSESERAPRSPQ